jgi:hypothetical protein
MHSSSSEPVPQPGADARCESLRRYGRMGVEERIPGSPGNGNNDETRRADDDGAAACTSLSAHPFVSDPGLKLKV